MTSQIVAFPLLTYWRDFEKYRPRQISSLLYTWPGRPAPLTTLGV